MTAEQFALEPGTAVELYHPRPVYQTQAEVGRISLEGFTMMEAVESPWITIREKLEERIIGQQAAIDAVIEALEASDVRMPHDNRPMATLAFLGPTGVGKSETAKTLAELMDSNKQLIKIDCSDYSNGHEVSNLTGSPLGYVGHDQEPLLSKERIEGYGTVVLFDEIEKGSPQLHNLMLQIMEDGELQLRGGAKTDFREAIIIITSNLGAKEMAAQLTDTPLGFGGTKKDVTPTQLDEVATKSFKNYFAPEFINRLSKMVVFHPLDSENLGNVLDSKLNMVNAQYEAAFGARISLSDATRQYLVDIASSEPSMGARPLVRALDEHIYTAFGRYYGAEAVPEGTHVKVFHRGELGLHVADSDSELVFMSKHDPSIRKATPKKELIRAATDPDDVVQHEASEPEPDEPEPEQE